MRCRDITLVSGKTYHLQHQEEATKQDFKSGNFNFFYTEDVASHRNASSIRSYRTENLVNNASALHRFKNEFETTWAFIQENKDDTEGSVKRLKRRHAPQEEIVAEQAKLDELRGHLQQLQKLNEEVVHGMINVRLKHLEHVRKHHDEFLEEEPRKWLTETKFINPVYGTHALVDDADVADDDTSDDSDDEFVNYFDALIEPAPAHHSSVKPRVFPPLEPLIPRRTPVMVRFNDELDIMVYPSKESVSSLGSDVAFQLEGLSVNDDEVFHKDLAEFKSAEDFSDV